MLKIFFFFLISIFSFAETKGLFQIGGDMPIIKNPTKTIEVKGGYAIETGVLFDTEIDGYNTDNFQTQFLIGYQVDKYDQKRKKKKPVRITLKRITISALEFYNFDNNMSLGLGLAYHISPKADYSYMYKNKMRNIERIFDSSVAALIQAGYKINENLDINLKATISKYSISVKRKKKTYFRSYNTSTLGLFLTYKF